MPNKLLTRAAPLPARPLYTRSGARAFAANGHAANGHAANGHAATLARHETTNHLLRALPDDEYARLAPQLRPLELCDGDVLHEDGAACDWVFLPDSGLVSLMLTSRDGIEVAVGVVGREGLVNHLACLGGPAVGRAVVQLAGRGWRLPARVLAAEFERGGVLQKVLRRYLLARHDEVTRAALCNCLHSIEERLCSHLLVASRRAGLETLDLTQETLAGMLGVRRASVTVTLGGLRRAGLIEYRRGHITLLDRAGLEARACECGAVA